MKVLYTGVRFEHYDPRRRHSFEYNNFYLTLRSMPGVEAIEHPFDIILERGRAAFNTELVDIVRREKPDVVFAFMYTDELDPAALRVIRDELKVPTVAWFADDYWRFWNYSKRWAPHFSHVVTTSPQAADWYKNTGITNVILSQWACNTALYRSREAAKDIDVSFVGQYKPARGRIVDMLKRAGISVAAYGYGWPNGKVSQDGMLNIFSRSKINLNLNVRPSRFEPRVLARLFLKKSVNRLVPDLHVIDNAKAWWHFDVPHTHARPFELAGCKAFVISGYSEGAETYYKPDTEMVFYRTPDELAAKIRYYLEHQDERDRIAQTGYERTLKDHTYEQRFRSIFGRVLGKPLAS
jgi:spore maturation protein CgeB